MDVDRTQPQAWLDKFVLAFIEGFYVYVISRRLARLLIKTTGLVINNSCFTMVSARFYCFQRAPGHSLKSRMQFGPAQNHPVDSVQIKP